MSTNIKYLAEQVSRDFIENKVPMNDSIMKIASERGYNKNFVDRLVEQSNQITYLSLFNSGHDKYASVNFDLADATAIKEGLFAKSEKVAKLYLEDYEVDNSAFEKEAAKKCKSKKKISDWQTRNELQKKAEYLRSRGGVNRVKFERALDKFAHEARVAVLLGKVSFEDMNAVFPPTFVEKVAQRYNIPGHVKEAASLSDGEINENHSLINSYNELSKLEDEYIDLHKEARELYKEVTAAIEEANRESGAKHMIGNIAEDIAKAWNVIKEIPAKHLVGYPAAFLLGVMYQKSQEQNATLTGNDVPLIFKSY